MYFARLVALLPIVAAAALSDAAPQVFFNVTSPSWSVRLATSSGIRAPW